MVPEGSVLLPRCSPLPASLKAVATFALWILLFGLPALRSLTGHPGEAGVLGEREFLKAWLPEPGRAPTRDEATLGQGWYLLFQRGGADEGRRALGRRLGVATAWVLTALSLALLVANAYGERAAALGLLLLALHPVPAGLGALASPWLPAAAFLLVALSFLQGLALPTLVRRPRSPAKWGARLVAILGAGLSLGLASTADEGIAWFILVPIFCFLLSTTATLAVLMGLWRRARARGLEFSGLLETMPPLSRRAGPWALAWFFMSLCALWLHERLGSSVATSLLHLPDYFPVETGERLLAWATFPLLLFLGIRELRSLSSGSRLHGRTVMLAGLFAFWLRSPALSSAPGPSERLLAASLFAMTLSAVLAGLPIRFRGGRS